MSIALLRRSIGAELEIRTGDTEGRTVYGIACPFDTSTQIYDWDGRYEEDFARGAFKKTIKERGDRVKFLAQHDSYGAFPLGRAAVLREDAAGLYAEFAVSKTARGDELIELVRDGVMDSLSIGFMPVKHKEAKTDGVRKVTRTEVVLREVSAVTFAAYDGTATIDGVRGGDDDVCRAIEILNDQRAGRPLSDASLAVLRSVLALATSAQAADVEDVAPEPPAAESAPAGAPDAGGVEPAPARAARSAADVRRRMQALGLRVA